MDGNGRWAARRGLPRVAGHRAGVATVRRIVEHAPKVGINCLTLYAFSADNWRRPPSEVQSIFWLMRAYLRLETERLVRAGVRMRMIGRRDRVPKLLLQEMERTEFATTDGCALHLRIAVDYSSREAISRTVVEVSRELSEKTSHPPEAFRDLLADRLTTESGDVDLLIRTGGEKRLSDFLLWESAYAELLFTERMWPDFDAADLNTALGEFGRRQRRFGALPQGA